MSINFNSLFEVQSCSQSQPDGQTCENKSKEAMNEHVPSPVVSKPSIYTNHDNREEIPDNKENQGVRIEVFPLLN